MAVRSYLDQQIQNEAAARAAGAPVTRGSFTDIANREVGSGFVDRALGTIPANTPPPAPAFQQTFLNGLLAQLQSATPEQQQQVARFAPQIQGLLGPVLQDTDIGRDEADYRSVGGGKDFIDMGMGFDASQVLGTSLEDIRKNKGDYPEVAAQELLNRQRAIAFANNPIGQFLTKIRNMYGTVSPAGIAKGGLEKVFPSLSQGAPSDQAVADLLRGDRLPTEGSGGYASELGGAGFGGFGSNALTESVEGKSVDLSDRNINEQITREGGYSNVFDKNADLSWRLY